MLEVSSSASQAASPAKRQVMDMMDIKLGSFPGHKLNSDAAKQTVNQPNGSALGNKRTG